MASSDSSWALLLLLRREPSPARRNPPRPMQLCCYWRMCCQMLLSLELTWRYRLPRAAVCCCRFHCSLVRVGCCWRCSGCWEAIGASFPCLSWTCDGREVVLGSGGERYRTACRCRRRTPQVSWPVPAAKEQLGPLFDQIVVPSSVDDHQQASARMPLASPTFCLDTIPIVVGPRPAGAGPANPFQHRGRR